MVARPKPAPDLFLLAAERLGARPQECVVIEDSPTGVQAAVGAGMICVGYAAAEPAEELLAYGARTTCRKMSELIGLLR